MSKKYVLLNDAREVVTQLIGGVHEIPAGAVLIDEARWLEVIQDVSCRWSLTDTGELLKLPKLDPAGNSAVDFERESRNQSLSSTDWLVIRHREEQEAAIVTSLAVAQFSELLAYRNNLRNWPSVDGYPDIANRPTEPLWLNKRHY